MQITVDMIGSTPLLMHNVRLADKEDEISRAIAALTAKKKHQTDIDRAEIAWLEWYGGLYLDDNKIVVPTANLVKLFREAAAVTRRGKDISRALQPPALTVPLIYDGPANLKKLYSEKMFVSRLPIRVSGQTVMRVRPQFHRWQILANFELVDEIMDLRDFEAIFERAGKTTGLGDFRVGGYGRFKGTVSASSELAAAAE